MSLTPGFRLGPYEITASIGAGGMGEVYRARDTRLGRDVAIKVLPQHLSADPMRRERFEREARAISALNHPHICTLHDIGSQATPQGTVEYLVMEHIEGETLADRLAQGPLPGDQVLRHAIAIADALDKAHRQGVVHRDLKPQNVMLTKNGAKLLDFGLAKLREAGAAGAPSARAPLPGVTPGSAGSILPTATRNLTSAGTLLGTFQYMAPEQLEGRESDARTDIFAFGSLVYEMATGRRAFDGRSQASLIAAILKEQPRAISELQPLSPPGLDRVVRACMAKDPDDRVQTAHDVRMQLEWVADGSLSGVGAGVISVPRAHTVSGPGGSMTMPGAPISGAGTSFGAGAVYATAPGTAADAVAGVGTRRGGGRTLVTTVAACVLAAAVAGALGYRLRPAPAPTRVLRVNVQLPPKTQLDAENSSLALSPDGRTLAYAASSGDGKTRLWVRNLDSLQSQALTGTEGASYPNWSPDGAFIAFFADQKLRKVQATGGTVQTVCEAQDGRGASWGAKGQIVFAPRPYGGLQIVSAAGGTPSALTDPETENTTHRLPRFLPDGRHLLFYSATTGKDEGRGIHVLDLETKKIALLSSEGSDGIFVPPGYLAFVRDGNLMAQSMDLGSLRLTGEAVPIAEKVQFNPARWTGAYSFSGDGLMIYQSGSAIAPRRLTWVGIDGREQGAIGEPANIIEVVLAPDQRRAAATVWSGVGVPNLWLYDLGRGVGTRFTFESGGGSSPVWSPDSRFVAYTSVDNRIIVKAADGASEPRMLQADAGRNRTVTGWTPDGSTLLFWEQDPKTGGDLYTLEIAGDAKPRPFLVTPANERGAKISPDGRWLLYSSDESGRTEVYATSYPKPGGKWQISTSGGVDAHWVEGGRRILYVDSENKLMSVDVAAAGGNLTIGAPRTLLDLQLVGGPGDLALDGRRALVARATEEGIQASLILVTDWTSALRKP